MSSDKPRQSRQEQAAAWFAAQRAGVMLVEQRAEFDAWRLDPRNQAALDAMHELWGDLAILKEPRTDARRRPAWPVRAMAAAAILIAVVTGSALVWRLTPHATSIATANGQQETKSLPDGSLLAVNVASRVSYTVDDKRRLVTLSAGEAAFSVKPDASRPFSVRAGDYEIRAIGTAFNVRYRESEIEVSVSEGSVEVCNVRRSGEVETLSSLAAGQQLRFPASFSSEVFRSARPEAIEPEHVAEWRMRVVSYENATVGEVVADFNRYFYRELVVEGRDLAARQVTIRLEVENRETALAVLANLLDVDVRKTPSRDVIAYRR